MNGARARRRNKQGRCRWFRCFQVDIVDVNMDVDVHYWGDVLPLIQHGVKSVPKRLGSRLIASNVRLLRHVVSFRAVIN